MAGGVIALGSTVAGSVALCGSADAVPDDPALIASNKYQSGPAEWGGTIDAGWQCLNFTMTDPQYFQYDYNASGVNSSGDSFEALAMGDLDADGRYSTFSLPGKIQSDGGDLVLIVAPNIGEVDPQE
jgi:type IV pilus assembly protein PilA